MLFKKELIRGLLLTTYERNKVAKHASKINLLDPLSKARTR